MKISWEEFIRHATGPCVKAIMTHEWWDVILTKNTRYSQKEEIFYHANISRCFSFKKKFNEEVEYDSGVFTLFQQVFDTIETDEKEIGNDGNYYPIRKELDTYTLKPVKIQLLTTYEPKF